MSFRTSLFPSDTAFPIHLWTRLLRSSFHSKTSSRIQELLILWATVFFNHICSPNLFTSDIPFPWFLMLGCNSQAQDLFFLAFGKALFIRSYTRSLLIFSFLLSIGVWACSLNNFSDQSGLRSHGYISIFPFLNDYNLVLLQTSVQRLIVISSDRKLFVFFLETLGFKLFIGLSLSIDVYYLQIHSLVLHS